MVGFARSINIVFLWSPGKDTLEMKGMLVSVFYLNQSRKTTSWMNRQMLQPSNLLVVELSNVFDLANGSDEVLLRLSLHIYIRILS